LLVERIVKETHAAHGHCVFFTLLPANTGDTERKKIKIGKEGGHSGCVSSRGRSGGVYFKKYM
jgi:hypothetical protein